MMIEMHHAIVAYVAMRSPLRAEYHACLAKLESVELRCGRAGDQLRYIEEMYALRLGHYIPVSCINAIN
jgi:hypothetical protein